MEFYVYVYLDTRKCGEFVYEDLKFDYEPFYIGKGKNDRHVSHLYKAESIFNGRSKSNSNHLLNKIISILKCGKKPIIKKIYENINEIDANNKEIELISLIGKLKENKGSLVNIANGGNGGITWIGENPFKGKKIEEICGSEKATQLREKMSVLAKERVGEKNPNYRNKGILNPFFGKKKQNCDSEETKKRRSEATLKYLNSLTTEEKLINNNKVKDAKAAISLEDKKKWYKKISDALKGREFSDEHRKKLQKCIRYNEWLVILPKIIKENNIKNISAYRIFAINNKELKLPIKPEDSYKNEGWDGWKVIFKHKNE